MSDPNIKWAATLAHVREVSLLGTADLAYWKGRLSQEDLLPDERDGKAQVMILAADSKYIRVRFRELSICVLVRADEGRSGTGGAYLAAAWNSCRFFAFCERAFFSTPYRHGDVRVRASAPASVRIVRDGRDVFLAEMKADPSPPGRAPSRDEAGGWEGPVFLPGAGGASGRGRKMFFARLRGHTDTYPFLHSADSLTLLPSRDGDALRALGESHFVPEQWVLREDAIHAKSRTYGRPAGSSKSR